jgi:shikimate kinase
MTDTAPASRPLVVLVGPPGAGKTTAGRLLATRWGVDFVDTDDVVEAQAGRSVADIFVESGESAFRAIEKSAVAQALHRNGVVALGGGAVLDPDTRLMLAHHVVVFLDVGLADAARRVGLNRDRPLLLGNVRGQWVELMSARRPVYEQVAQVRVATDGLDAEQVADAVLAALTDPAASATQSGEPA